MVILSSAVAWYVFLAAVLLAFQRMTRCFTQLNIFTVCIGFFLLRNGLTVPFDDAANEAAAISLSPLALHRFYVALVMMWLGLLAGVWTGRQLFGTGVLNLRAFHDELRAGPLRPGMNVPLFLGALAVSVGLVVVYQLGSADVSLVRLLSGALTSGDYRLMRESFGEATHNAAGLGPRLANIVRFGLFPFFIATLFFMSSRSWLWRSLFLTVLGIGLIVGLLSGQKGASVIMLVAVALGWFIRRGRLRIRTWDRRIWVSVAVVWLVAMPYLYHLQYPDEAYSWLLHVTTNRLTTEYNRGLQLYFEVYPDVHPFLDGRSSGLINALRGINLPLDMLPERFIPIHYLGPEYVNTWNAAFIGVAWADFGYAGVIVESILVGLLLQAYAAWFRRRRKTALVMGTQVGLMIATTRISEVALTASLLSFGLLSSFLVSWVVRIDLRTLFSPSPAVPSERVGVSGS